MEVFTEKNRLRLTLSRSEGRLLRRILESVRANYLIKPSGLDAKAASVWYSTRGCQTAGMSPADTEEWLANLFHYRSGNAEAIAGWMAQLSRKSPPQPQLTLPMEQAQLFLTVLNDHRLLQAACHDLGEGEMRMGVAFSADVAYLKFSSQADRSGTSLVRLFDPSSITSVDLNRYTSDKVQLSLKMVFGNVRPSLATIEGVELLGGIYPSAHEVRAYRPIGRARVKNISDRPIEARARFYIERYMDDPTESQPVYILPGEIQEIPITAVFNELVKGVERMIVREGNVYVSATAAEEYDDKYAMPVLIHGTNDWDGNVYSLRYFVTPDDPAVIRYTRDILLQHKDS